MNNFDKQVYRTVIGVLRNGNKQTILVGSFMFQVPLSVSDECIRRFLRSFLARITKKDENLKFPFFLREFPFWINHPRT